MYWEIYDFLRALGLSDARSQQLAGQLEATRQRLDDCDNILVLAHFLAQCAHESGRFKFTREIASGAAYEGRRDLGNTQPGDGRRFKGAGFIQLTGRANYLAFSRWIGDPKVMQGVEYVAEHYPWESAIFYWQSRKISRLAARDDILAVSRAINGGTNGLAERREFTALAKKVIQAMV